MAIKCDSADDESCKTVVNEFNADHFLAADVNHWSSEGKVFRRTYECGESKSFVGGPDQLTGADLTKTFIGLPSHIYLVITFSVVFVDEWD
jgi:hypothetical protein